MVALGNGATCPFVKIRHAACGCLQLIAQPINRLFSPEQGSQVSTMRRQRRSKLRGALGQVDRNILFCAPACTESAISMSIRIFPAVSATPVSIRPVCSRALALHSGFLFLLCCLRSHAVEFVLGPE